MKALADAEFYTNNKIAEANNILLTPGYLQLENIKSLANVSKIYFGEKIPNTLIDPSIFQAQASQHATNKVIDGKKESEGVRSCLNEQC